MEYRDGIIAPMSSWPKQPSLTFPIFGTRLGQPLGKFAIKRADQWVKVKSEGLAFHFEDYATAVLFAAHCAHSKIEYSCRWPNQS